MKKVLKILCVVMVIGLGVSLVACSKNYDGTENTDVPEVISTQTTEAQTESISKTQNNDYEIETTETHYNHSAIQGCVIVEQDGTPMVQYSEKCESCGYISLSKHTINHFDGGYTTSFLCPQCQNNQAVEINTNTY